MCTEERPRENTVRRYPGLRRNQICRHLVLGLLVSRTVREQISAVEATQSVGFCSGSLSKQIQQLRRKIKQKKEMENEEVGILLWRSRKHCALKYFLRSCDTLHFTDEGM